MYSIEDGNFVCAPRNGVSDYIEFKKKKDILSIFLFTQPLFNVKISYVVSGNQHKIEVGNYTLDTKPLISEESLIEIKDKYVEKRLNYLSEHAKGCITSIVSMINQIKFNISDLNNYVIDASEKCKLEGFVRNMFRSISVELEDQSTSMDIYNNKLIVVCIYKNILIREDLDICYNKVYNRDHETIQQILLFLKCIVEEFKIIVKNTVNNRFGKTKSARF